MLRIAGFLLVSLTCGVLTSSPFEDFQEQFADFSLGVEFELQVYRAKNNLLRGEVVHRMVESLGNLTVEMRNITADYWAQIVAHEYSTEECLDLIRPDFDWYVLYASLDIQYMAIELEWLMDVDALERFNPTVSHAQRENSRSIYITVQTLGRNPFLDNMVDTVIELQVQLESSQSTWTALQATLEQELQRIDDLRQQVEYRIEFWHEFSVRWHHVFMGYMVVRPENECRPDTAGVKGVKTLSSESFRAKQEEMRANAPLKALQRDLTSHKR